ncbi:MAG: hypothetical protein IPJ76_11930 [Flavobacteriales bacterium]|nr:MAG: hypothetical protein IPJ76_11930 [Flavobacteriales bacterium]
MAALDGEVVSVTRGRPSYYSLAEEVITISAPVMVAPFRLDCIGRARVSGGYYRLDMEMATGQTKFVPVKDVLLEGKVRNDLLGIVLLESGTRDVFVPATVSSNLRKGAVGAADSLFVKFLPRIVLRDLALDVYDAATQELLYSTSLTALLKADNEVMMGIPVAALGSSSSKERRVLVQLKSIAIDGGPQLDRAFTIVLPES